MGARIAIDGLKVENGEPVGNLTVESSDLSGIDVRGRWIAYLIDEIPILTVLGARTRNGIRIREAGELRTKETDRIRALVQNLKALRVDVEEFEDGLYVPGGQTIRGGTVDSFGDHRIAMAFAVAGLFAEDPVNILNASCVSVSFPGFFELLKQVAG